MLASLLFINTKSLQNLAALFTVQLCFLAEVIRKDKNKAINKNVKPIDKYLVFDIIYMPETNKFASICYKKAPKNGFHKNIIK